MFLMGSGSFWRLEAVLVLVCRTYEIACVSESLQRWTGDRRCEVWMSTREFTDAKLWRICEFAGAEDLCEEANLGRLGDLA